MKRNPSASLLFFLAVILCGNLPFRRSALLNAQTPLSWVTVRDNREQAFSIEVPNGWKVHGGMFRFGSVDARVFVDMTSPDGQTNIRVGDATIPGYSVPSPWQPRQPNMAAYATGEVFAKKYGQARFSSMCQSLQVQQTRPMAPKYHQAGQGLIRVTGGEAFFACSEKGRAMTGYVYAETMLTGPGGPGSIWTVVALGSILAPGEQSQAAGAILKHSGESLAHNPEWARMQQELTDMEIQRLQANTRATIAATEAQTAHAQKMMKIMQQQNDNFNDVINGVTFTRDPQTGQTREVQTLQGRAKWIDGRNNVVDSTLSPGPAFHQLQVISR